MAIVTKHVSLFKRTRKSLRKIAPKFKQRIGKDKRDPIFTGGHTLQKAREFVRDIQSQIAEALRENKTPLALKLANKLVRNRAAARLALHKVLSNKGGRTKGLNDIKPTKEAHYSKIISDIWEVVKKPESYRSTPLSRIYLEKPNGGLRPISIPTYFDRTLQGLYNFALDVWAEQGADKFSYGFRRMRSTHMAAKMTWLLLNNKSKDGPPTHIVELDIANCFPTMDHNFMESHIPFVPKHILREWFTCGYVEKDNGIWYETTAGIPQGGLISPTMANMVLDGVEQHVDRFMHMHLTGRLAWTRVIRYADDMVILTYSAASAQLAILAATDFLEPRGMRLSPTKTKVTVWKEQSFQFVGFRFYGREVNGKWNIYYDIPPLKLEKFYNYLKEVSLKSRSPIEFFYKANRIIRGFCLAYYTGNVVDQFRQMRTRIWYRTYKILWAFYSEVSKYKDRVKDSKITAGYKNKNRLYFKAIKETIKRYHWKYQYRGAGKGCFWWAVYLPERKKQRWQRIFIFDPTTIKLKGGSTLSGLSAYHPEDLTALTKIAIRYRLGIQGKVLGKKGGECACCGINLLMGDIRYELHHIKPIFLGGDMAEKNLVCLCKECHLEVTNSVKSNLLDKVQEYVNRGILHDSVFNYVKTRVDSKRSLEA